MITREQITAQWIKIAERNLLAAKQGLEAKPVAAKEVCYNCREAVEKFLKAFLVKQQIKFDKEEALVKLLELCAAVDNSFRDKLAGSLLISGGKTGNSLAGGEPSAAQADKAYALALEVQKFVLGKLNI